MQYLNFLKKFIKTQHNLFYSYKIKIKKKTKKNHASLGLKS